MKEKIECPFYMSDTERCIYCESLASDIAETGLFFSRPENKDKHKTKFCCGENDLCPQYICNCAIEGA